MGVGPSQKTGCKGCVAANKNPYRNEGMQLWKEVRTPAGAGPTAYPASRCLLQKEEEGDCQRARKGGDWTREAKRGERIPDLDGPHAFYHGGKFKRGVGGGRRERA